ncbi:MAG: hypothetical protein LBT75_03360 [Bacilli bacterium]|jgi:uncharacterized alkaline shock family protein YloU|nr:hypothetical protein [Bacilli bacterium]
MKKDELFISTNVIHSIINEVINENKNLFLNKTHLNFKNKGISNIEIINEEVLINLVLNTNYAIDILKLVSTLQNDIKQMIEHITIYKIKDINIELMEINK